MKYYAQEALLAEGWTADVTITIADGKVTAITPGKEAGAVELNGPLVPGMTNLHSHAFQKAFAGLTEYRANPEDSFWSWRDSMYRLLPQLTPDDMQIIARYLYIEMLRSGYTSVVEFHYLHHQPDGQHYDDAAATSCAVIDAARTVGLATTHCPVFYSYANFGEKPAAGAQKAFFHTPEQFVQLLDKLHQQYADDSSVKLGIAPHSLRAVSQAQLNELVPWWQQHEAQGPFHIHIAEQMKEVNECVDFYGARPVEWLYDQVDVNERWCLVHATHLSDQEVKTMALSKAIAGICATTEANLGDGVFRGVDYLSYGGRWGIGSDSHISVNAFEELRLYEYGQRYTHQKRNLLCDEQRPHVGDYLWTEAVAGGAQVANRGQGSIAVGEDANWVVLDRDVAELSAVAKESLLDAAIFAANENLVRDVMVNGTWRIENKHHAEWEQAQEDYRQMLKRLAANA
ncbi:formimidoylglutamate deiminase [Pleionea sp. CnH1-48]|uniref:formimidoylglutamate deiminase n=1 Tax=Pleionea sp. CnH1-48 TaxID=2954494 RepID=UPI002096FC8F|nr:formimidoylglutamate deiminase [Pleionea sp. CnH1-48]MCO7227204.1 formimidoylglutamate deiminase [Pleionea sp. CnH1-48]